MSAGELAPCRGIVKAEWTQVEQQAGPETLSGDADVLELGESYWEVDIDVDLPKRADFDQWFAFLSRRKGRAVTFTMPRTFRKKPRDSSISSDAGVALAAVNAGAGTITLSGVGSGKAFEGDMVSYRTTGSGYYIGVVTADALPSGGSITLPVWPEPAAAHASPTPRRIEALGEFRLIDKPRWRETAHRRSVRFKARQVIR